jgi:hypothetical protein
VVSRRSGARTSIRDEIGRYRREAWERSPWPPQDEFGTADADWLPIPDHTGVGRWEDARAFIGTNLRSFIGTLGRSPNAPVLGNCHLRRRFKLN